MSKPRHFDLDNIARDRFGYDSLRPEQETVIRHLLAGHDTLAVLPTGSGKSAIYQTAGVLMEGATVVVSPLIALQHDQVAHIEGHDLPEGRVLNSHTPAAKVRETWQLLAEGKLEYLFLAPEQLAGGEALQRLTEHPPSLFVVDEAHCVSEWGNDFRPDFGRLGKVIERLGRPRVLALTATATPTVQEDIVKRLGMREHKFVVGDLDRPNLSLAVEVMPDAAAKLRLLPDRVRKLADAAGCEKTRDCCGIVYTATRAHAEEVAQLLSEENVPSDFYHGGLNRGQRERAYNRWMNGEAAVMVATSAFGMGVDKPDVRYVIHFDVPDSLDAFYQEVGRAGRDGEPAATLLLYREADLGLQKSLSAPARLDADAVADALETVVGDGTSIDYDTLQGETEQTGGKLRRTLDLLEQIGAIETTLDGEALAVTPKKKLDVPAISERVIAEQDRFRDYRSARLAAMQQYAETGRCRRTVLLDYFGQERAGPCGHCDNCRLGRSGEAEEKKQTRDDGRPFAVGANVEHRKFGRGRVQKYDGREVVVLFEAVGSKSLVADFAREKKLMTEV